MAKKLDQTNIDIIACLQKNARMSITAIGNKVHLSSDTVKKRITQLEKDGYITGYTTILNKDKIGNVINSFIMVSLTPNSDASRLVFSNALEKFPEVIQYYYVNGDYDYLLHTAVSNMKEFEIFHSNLITAANNISRLKSMFVIKEEKGNTSPHFGNLS